MTNLVALAILGIRYDIYQGKRRGRMPRPPRIYIEKGLYFITTRGDHGGELFRDETDRIEYLNVLDKYKKQYKFKLYSYVLLPTFIHLLLEPAQGTTISEIMHIINTTYTKYFNGRYQRHGHLFEGRFRSCLIERAGHFLEVTGYIHLAPVILRIVDRPEDYRWSSYPVYVRKERDLLDTESDAKEVLATLSRDSAEQVRLYKDFVYSMPKEALKQLRKKLETSWVLGSKPFIDGLRKRLREELRKEEDRKKRVWLESGTRRVFILAGSLAIIILFLLNLYLYRANLGLRALFEQALERKRAEYIKRLEKEKELLREDIEEKYRADMVSYQAMHKRLEIEKEKARKMEEELKKLKK